MPAPTPRRHPTSTTAPDPAAILEGVGLVRDGRAILADVDWTIRAGDRWILLGPNGCGKTTLLQVLSTYLYPTRGTVTVLGERHGRTDVRALRRRIGYASAALARLLKPRLTAFEAVVTGADGVLDPWWGTYGEAEHTRARSLLERFGCAPLADQAIGLLSEGERQRVQIARALMTDPDLLLLDEPTAGLDLGAREQLVAQLAGLAADPSAPPMVFVTHHVEEIPRHFTHAMLMRSGRVVARGPLAGTLTAGALSACFAMPLHLEARDGRYAAWGAPDAAPLGEVDGAAGPRRAGATGEAIGRQAAEMSDRGLPGDAPRDTTGDPAAGAAEADAVASPGTLVDRDGRRKAYRPLPLERRLEALDEGLGHYLAGDFFEAHEVLEPAWMGARDQDERDVYQGLIKLAAAGVHAVRGNAPGVRRNLEGARRRLGAVPPRADAEAGPAAGADTGDPRDGLDAALARVDVARALGWIDGALVELGDPATAERAAARATAPAPVSRRP